MSKVDAGGDLVVDGSVLVHLDPVLAHDGRADVDEALGVAHLRRPLERAVDEGRAQVAEVELADDLLRGLRRLDALSRLARLFPGVAHAQTLLRSAAARNRSR
jgi:hypothetical protein